MNHSERPHVALRPAMTAYLRERGVTLRSVLREAAIEPADIAHAARRPSHALRVRLLEAASRAAADEHIGLSLGRRHNAWNANVVGFLMSTSGTFGEALEQLRRHQGLFSEANAGDFDLDSAGDEVRVRILAEPRSRHVSEFLAYQVAVNSRSVVLEPVHPLRIGFRTAPSEPRAVEAAFGSPVRFDADHDEVVLSRAAMQRPLKAANPAMRAFFEAEAARSMARLEDRSRVSSRARNWIATHLPGGSLRLERAARALGMSGRSLQRHLREEGYRMQDLVDEVRRNRALAMLDDDVDVATIVETLGFSEPSAFYRSFKRWTGKTVSEYRDAQGR